MSNHMMWADAKPDDRMAVWFFTKPIKNAQKSLAEGTPQFDAIDFVHIQHPGERDYQERPVKEQDKVRWPKQWAFYKEGKDQKIGDGTPLDFLFPQNPEVIEMLRGQHVYTVQQLAILTAEAESRLGMGGTMWVQKAQKYLATAKSTEDFRKMQAELDKRDITISTLENTVKDLSARVDQMMRDRTPAAPAPSRPAKHSGDL